MQKQKRMRQQKAHKLIAIALIFLHNHAFIITLVSLKKREDGMTAIGIQVDCNSVDFLEDLLISCKSPIVEEETKDTAAQNTTINNRNIESLISRHKQFKRRKESKIKRKI